MDVETFYDYLMSRYAMKLIFGTPLRLGLRVVR